MKTPFLDLIRKSVNSQLAHEGMYTGADTRFTMEELENLKLGRDALGNSGPTRVHHPSSLTIPLRLPPSKYGELLPEYQRSILTQEYLLQNEQQFLINPISEKSIFIQAGALYLPFQVNKINVPSFTGISASWVNDGSEPDSDGDEITIKGKSFAAQRMFVCLDVPRDVIMQPGPEMEQWLKDNITAKLAEKVDETIGGIAASSTTKPQGMGYKITTGADTKAAAIAPEYHDIVAMEEALGALKSPVKNFAFVTNAAGRRILRKVFSEGGNAIPVYKDGKILDYPSFISNQVSAAAGSDGAGNLLIFGDFKELAIVQFGAYEIIVDPFTLKKIGKVQLYINAYFDFKGLRPAVSTGTGTQDDDYAGSFTTLAIK